MQLRYVEVEVSEGHPGTMSGRKQDLKLRGRSYLEIQVSRLNIYDSVWNDEMSQEIVKAANALSYQLLLLLSSRSSNTHQSTYIRMCYVDLQFIIHFRPPRFAYGISNETYSRGIAGFFFSLFPCSHAFFSTKVRVSRQY